MDEHQGLAHRATIAALVGVYQAAAADIRAAFASVEAAEQRLNDAFTMGNESYKGIRVTTDGGSHHYGRWNEAEASLKAVERQAWRAIVDRLELRRMMSVRAWAEMEKKLERDELPELTVDNVQAMATGMLSQLPEMLAEAVNEVFEWLRPPHSKLKTNTQLEVGRRAIVGYTVERKWSGGGFQPHYHAEAKLTALENVFSAIDGRGQISKGYYSLLSTAIKGAPADGRGATDLFGFRACGNGNLHLEFLRPDLLAKFNAMAGGKRLRPEARPTSKKNDIGTEITVDRGRRLG
jgi:hypothetical protein